MTGRECAEHPSILCLLPWENNTWLRFKELLLRSLMCRGSSTSAVHGVCVSARSVSDWRPLAYCNLWTWTNLNTLMVKRVTVPVTSPFVFAHVFHLLVRPPWTPISLHAGLGVFPRELAMPSFTNICRHQGRWTCQRQHTLLACSMTRWANFVPRSELEIAYGNPTCCYLELTILLLQTICI